MMPFYFSHAQTASSPFFVKPYLQVGYHPSETTLELLWQGSEGATFVVEKKNAAESGWTKMQVPKAMTITIAGFANRVQYQSTLTALLPGTSFQYRVSKGSTVVFSAEAKAPASAAKASRFVVFGDIGAGTPEAKAMTHQAYEAKPALIVVPGDIVYDYGLLSEYETRFWPVYNTDKVDSAGAPLMRSIPFISAVGNHDADTRDLDAHPDALGYYSLWQQPLNGPLRSEGTSLVPALKASPQARKAFTDAAGDAYPRMANFSYNWGAVHWTILDADTYVDWTDSSLQKWVSDDLASAKNSTWRFVIFHHPGFNSSRDHYEQQQMRLLSPVFEKGGVDVVFNGHVHNYQRSYPLRFVPDNGGILLAASKAGKPRGRVVNGMWTLDKKYNGTTVTKPDGVLYIVTGAGGQDLYNPEQTGNPDSWQKFTYKFMSTIHSLTIADVDGKKLTVRQVGEDGKEIDKFIVTK